MEAHGSTSDTGQPPPHHGAAPPAELTGKIIPFPSRSVTIDLVRVLAIMFMIQGHTLDVLLAASHREGMVFHLWLFLRGLTAPMFLLLSGFSFAISTTRHWDSYQHCSSSLWHRLRRFGSFILLGYAMHLPGRSIQAFRELDDAGWHRWLQVDILQCI
jgi:acyltransferase